MCAFIIFYAIYELTIRISGLDFELIRAAGRGETNVKLINRWHALESGLDPRSNDYNDSHVKFCFKYDSARHGKDALD